MEVLGGALNHALMVSLFACEASQFLDLDMFLFIGPLCLHISYDLLTLFIRDYQAQLTIILLSDQPLNSRKIFINEG